MRFRTFNSRDDQCVCRAALCQIVVIASSALPPNYYWLGFSAISPAVLSAERRDNPTPAVEPNSLNGFDKRSPYFERPEQHVTIGLLEWLAGRHSSVSASALPIVNVPSSGMSTVTCSFLDDQDSSPDDANFSRFAELPGPMLLGRLEVASAPETLAPFPNELLRPS